MSEADLQPLDRRSYSRGDRMGVNKETPEVHSAPFSGTGTRDF